MSAPGVEPIEQRAPARATPEQQPAPAGASPVQLAVERFEALRDTLRAVDYQEIEVRMATFATLEPAALSRVVEILGFRPERSRKRNVELLCRVLQGIKSRQRRVDLI